MIRTHTPSSLVRERNRHAETKIKRDRHTNIGREEREAELTAADLGCVDEKRDNEVESESALIGPHDDVLQTSSLPDRHHNRYIRLRRTDAQVTYDVLV